MHDNYETNPPILRNKEHGAPSVFRPENLLREARRQKGIEPAEVPPVVVLDPDGDVLRYLKQTGRAEKCSAWSCYHSELYVFAHEGARVGIIGCAVGAPYAVLIAEQLFVSGCRFLMSITSSGQLTPSIDPPYFIVVERALRDEGVSYHYLPPSDFAHADPELIGRLFPLLEATGLPLVEGATWTTDAPFRETEGVLVQGRELGLLAIEMECAALYALAKARSYPILCLAHVTNTMAVAEKDFEKGDEQGAIDALRLIGAVVEGLSPSPGPPTGPSDNHPDPT